MKGRWRSYNQALFKTKNLLNIQGCFGMRSFKCAERYFYLCMDERKRISSKKFIDSSTRQLQSRSVNSLKCQLSFISWTEFNCVEVIKLSERTSAAKMIMCMLNICGENLENLYYKKKKKEVVLNGAMLWVSYCNFQKIFY